jgi:hypothetical protein
LTGRLILVKLVLSTLPFFNTPLCYPDGSIKREIAQEIRKFLWEGGKSNNKIFHLVNWQVVRAPKSHGGLGVKDPILANLALGSKMLWRMITREFDWWKKSLIFKYFQKDRLRGLENQQLHPNGSPIWKLLQASFPLLQRKLTWIPGNGKCIRIWDDITS